MVTLDEGVTVGSIHLRLDVFKVDALQRFGDMQVARLAIGAWAVPVEDPISGIAILLDLVDEEASAYRVEATAWDKDEVAFLRGDGVNLILGVATSDTRLKALSGDS